MVAATLEIMMTDGLTQAVAMAVGSRGTVAEETDRTVVDTVGQEGEGEGAQTHGAE